MDLEIALRSFGAEIVARVGDLDEAHDRVAKGDFDVAVVDINLRGRDTFSVADVLRKKQIPFVFATGYGKEMIPARFADVTLWEKPFSELKVARDVARLCHHAQAGIS
jgi:CheY-like chemotaxis protein